MRMHVFFALCAFLIPCVSHATPQAPWLGDHEVCKGLVAPRAARICERIQHSRDRLNTEHPKLIADKRGNVTKREIILVAWDAADTPHTIRLTMPFRPHPGKPIVLTTLTPGYTVGHIRGTSAYKLEFRVTHGTEELLVYGGKHVWIPSEYKNERSLKKLSPVVEERQYMPFLEHLYHPELAARGLRYLELTVHAARDELRGVPSKAFPGWKLPEVYPNEVLLNLIVSEQTDPYKLFDTNVTTALPRSTYLLGVLVEIAMHGPHAFAGLCSHASACGLLQFTNKRVKQYPGTYTYTYQNCKTTSGTHAIDRNFKRGAQDTKNAVKAAICYLDIENAAMPHAARAEYLSDPRRGSIYILAAYNAGGVWSKKVFENVQRMRTEKNGVPLLENHESVPKDLFVKNKQYNQETHWYIKKYLWSWDLLFAGRTIALPAS